MCIASGGGGGGGGGGYTSSSSGVTKCLVGVVVVVSVSCWILVLGVGRTGVFGRPVYSEQMKRAAGRDMLSSFFSLQYDLVRTSLVRALI